MPPDTSDRVGRQVVQRDASYFLLGGWDHAVHAQIFHHLAVVIVGKGHRINRKLQTSVLLASPNPPWQRWRQRVLCSYGSHGPMQRKERAFDVVHDLGF
jgi:hypothetical protein